MHIGNIRDEHNDVNVCGHKDSKSILLSEKVAMAQS